MGKKIIFSLLLIMLFSGIANATISSVDYPKNGQILTSPTIDLQITSDGSTCTWNYNQVVNNSLLSCDGDKIRLPPVEGQYNITVYDDDSSEIIGVTVSLPSDFLTLGAIIIFVLGIFLVLITLFKNIESISKFSTSLYEVIYSMSVYFGILSMNYFNLEYFGNSLITDITDMFITVGAFTHMFFPLVGLVLSMIAGGLKQNQ